MAWDPGAVLARVRLKDASLAGHGCEYCRSQIARGAPELTLLGHFRDARHRFEHSSVQLGVVSYQSVTIYECPRCQVPWLSYFEEVDDVETTMSEWGRTLTGYTWLTHEERDALLDE